MAAVRCIDLCRTYYQGDQAIKALDHVNLEIEEGGFVCLSAPSGGGKTTLLNAIGGLDRPDKGEVWIAGQRIDNLSKGALAKLRLHQIGFVFQAFNLIPAGRSRPAGPGRPATRRHVRRSATACRRRTGNCVPAGAGAGG
jgi:putative ABC transport system ATP-binding protein